MSLLTLLDSWMHRISRFYPPVNKDVNMAFNINKDSNMAFNINKDSYMAASINKDCYV